jgi:peptide/nickel transport system permease protein
VRKAPSAAHWFGTDEVGRDILARVLYGARASLLAGVMSVLIAIGFGVPLGVLAGYMGGIVDSLIGRITDATPACPFLILAIALAAFLGPSLTNAMIAIGVTATPIFIRLTRGQVLVTKAEDYGEAARSIGNPHWRIAVRHILPNVLPQLLVQATLTIATAIIAEASLPSWDSVSNRPPTHLGWRSGPVSPSSSRCCPSTSSETACATPSIRAQNRKRRPPFGAGEGHRRKQRLEPIPRQWKRR